MGVFCSALSTAAGEASGPKRSAILASAYPSVIKLYLLPSSCMKVKGCAMVGLPGACTVGAGALSLDTCGTIGGVLAGSAVCGEGREMVETLRVCKERFMCVHHG